MSGQSDVELQQSVSTWTAIFFLRRSASETLGAECRRLGQELSVVTVLIKYLNTHIKTYTGFHYRTAKEYGV